MVSDRIRKYMEEVSSLPRKNYLSYPRKQLKIFGEVSALGLFDPEDKQDMLSFVRSANRKGLSEEYFLSGKEAIQWAADPVTNKKGNRHVLYAIRGSNKVSSEEIGEVQGYIYFSADRVVSAISSQLRKFKLYKDLSLAVRFFEISYAKKPGAAPHQVASAVRQAIFALTQNPASHRKNQAKSRTFPQLEVIAAIDLEENADSKYVLEAAGFERVGLVDYEGEGWLVGYRLNWIKFFKRYQKLKDLEIAKSELIRRGTRSTLEIKINPLTSGVSTWYS